MSIKFICEKFSFLVRNTYNINLYVFILWVFFVLKNWKFIAPLSHCGEQRVLDNIIIF